MMNLEEQMKRVKSGLMYKDTTPELIGARARAVELTDRYNATYGQPPEVREKILKELLGKIGKNVFFEPSFRCEFGRNIEIGDNFYANFDCIMLDGGGIIIGNNVLFGPRVSIYTSRHAFDAEERAAGACFSQPVVIGNNVWVGGGVHMDCGIRIGDNSIIGAGSVITRDVPANVVAAGAPCRVIREIKPEEKTDYFQILKELYSDPE
jgi:maltose O-acetyltransferase